MKWKYFYIFRIQYLGFRFHGWQKQPGLNTVQEMIDKTFRFILEDKRFKTLGSGRTDAMVSADDFAFELFTDEPIDLETFLDTYNFNLPTDIRLNSITQTDAKFNIIQASKMKTYRYYFSQGKKQHPFSAPFLFCFKEALDIELMKRGAKEFEGSHNFKRFTSKPSEKSILTRTLNHAEIVTCDQFESVFYPELHYYFEVQSSGFLRYQVRLMMGSLLQLGSGEVTFEEFKEFLENPEGQQIKNIAPKSGLRLSKLEFGTE
jgi:tRNA pseudouridine38-40 synthase